MRQRVSGLRARAFRVPHRVAATAGGSLISPPPGAYIPPSDSPACSPDLSSEDGWPGGLKPSLYFELRHQQLEAHAALAFSSCERFGACFRRSEAAPTSGLLQRRLGAQAAAEMKVFIPRAYTNISSEVRQCSRGDAVVHMPKLLQTTPNPSVLVSGWAPGAHKPAWQRLPYNASATAQRASAYLLSLPPK